MTLIISRAILVAISQWPLWLVGGSPRTIDPGGSSTWNGRIAPAFIG
jgi:hypothetical protein